MILFFFGILYETHLSIGHGSRDRMIKELNRRYKNIEQNDTKIFLNFWESCQQKLKEGRKGLVVKPMILSYMNSRCQVELIDFQSQRDGNYKFVLVYQDHLIKFVILRPLQTKRAELVAGQLLDIFLLFWPPCTVVDKKNATLVVIPTHIIVEKWNWYHSSWKSVLFKVM